MSNLAAWDYDKSVEKMRPLVARWKNVTAEMLGELYQAREALSRERNRLSVANATLPTWSGYCQDIGLDRSTVHRWLSQYDPVTHTIVEIEPPPKPKPLPQYKESAIQQPVDETEFGGEEEGMEYVAEEEREEKKQPPCQRVTYSIYDDDPDAAVKRIKEYIEMLLEDVEIQSARHMIINSMIKYFRELSIQFNREVGVT